MAKVFLLFSHRLLENQIEELKTKFSCEKVIYLPEDLQKLWSNLDNIDDNYLKFCKFLEENAEKNDYILIQGEWGLTYKMIRFCKKKLYIPIYSFSKRVAYEKIEDNKIIKTSYFEHIEFREYKE